MLAATLIGVFFIPLFFAVIRGATERLTRRTPAPVPAGEGA